MPGPPPWYYAFDIGSPDGARPAPGRKPPSRPGGAQRKQPKTRRSAPIGQILAWVIGLGGYAGLLIAGHGSRDADALHGFAVVWLIVFGALNAHFILQRR